MKKFFLLPTFTLLACLFPFPNVIAEVSQKQPKEISEKKVEPKKKYTFIGKLWEKEKLEPENKDGDKKEEDKKGKKGKKGKRSYLLKFEVKEVMDGEDALNPGLFVLCVTDPGPLRNPNQVKGFQTEPGELYRIVSTAKLVKEKEVNRLTDCRLFSAKGKAGDEYKVGKTWNGALPVKSLEFLPEDQRQSPIAYLGDNKAFTAFLESFTPFDKKAPAPQVDFSKNVIVVMKNVRRMEQIIGLKARLDEGTLRVMPKKDFDGFDPRNPLRIVKGQVFVSFFILPRKGITTIASGKKHEFEIKPPGFIYAD